MMVMVMVMVMVMMMMITCNYSVHIQYNILHSEVIENNGDKYNHKDGWHTLLLITVVWSIETQRLEIVRGIPGYTPAIH